ncbi:hypothetical protein [Spirosoma sordidisoli]|uniref:Uncharacterized protein n=1 Tax=Spirosoma sordidisoli TaxID=2502893 RepID=A0A4Q2UKL3_9BACT|nr:hypothetical protein [Spirosoma sordidisoli]RYC70067.1 hypothetical protein EQG79_09355 [Spirosoma sordidisoli]
MKKDSKLGVVIFVFIVSVMLIRDVYRHNELSKTLKECSVYTVGNIYKVYTLRGMPHAKYTYNIGSYTIKYDERVNNFDTGETWSVDAKKLAKRRLFLQVSCSDINTHRILWNTTIPDTLHQIPTEGWQQKPSWVKEWLH